MKYCLLSLVSLSLFFSSCIGDDIIQDTIAEDLRIMNPIDTLGAGDTYQFEATFFNNVGQEEMKTVSWASSNTAILTINNTGLATGVAMGTATITAEVELVGADPIQTNFEIVVAEETIINPSSERTGTLQTTSSYTLQGTFVLKEVADGLELELMADYAASSSLPGLFVYLSNNPNSTSGAYEIGPATSFSGAHSYQLPNSIGLNDFSHVLYFCKPFNVKVGDGSFGN